jgi:hypothetical protein
MNIVGYIISLIVTILAHIFLKKFIKMQDEQKELIERYRSQLDTGRPLDYDAVERESHQKYMDFKDYNYKGVDFSKIEDEDGYDIDNDYDLMKEDLLKYVDGANNYFNPTQRSEPVATEKKNIKMNHNASLMPLDKKENPFKGLLGGVTLDSQYKSQFESNNRGRNSINPTIKTLKPDLWVYGNEKTMNGGFFDEKTSLMPFDAQEENNYVLL